ncbi:MAG: hypothetical protein QXK88_06875 [Desulfurococcaceae archaeon]
MINVLAFMYLLRLDAQLAISLSMASMAPPALSPLMRHLADRLVDWNIGIPLSVGAVMGAFSGPE